MPSKNTRVLAVRVKEKTYSVLNIAAENAKMSVPKLIDEIAECLDNRVITIEAEGLITTNLDVGDDEVNLDGLRRLAEAEGDTVQNLLDYLVDRYRIERERSI